MSKFIINVAYDGTALAAGSMDVRELAPALMAINDLLEESNSVLNANKAGINVRVKSDFKTGSFQIVLELVQTVSEQVKSFFDQGISAKDLAFYIGLAGSAASITGASLIGIIKWLKGRKIKKVIVLENGNFRIEAEGPYEAMEVSDQVVKLYRNIKVRNALKSVLSPLDREGVDRFIVRDEKKEIQRVEKAEQNYFSVPELEEEKILDVTRKGAFNVIGVFFEENLKWKLFDGENRINASIKDLKFMEALDKGKVSFTKGDILEVELRTVQFKTEQGLKTEHEVIRVIKQHKAYEQLPLPFASENGEVN